MFYALAACGGFFAGFIAAKLFFLAGYGDAFSEGYFAGKAKGHVEGFKQGREVSAKAVNS